MKHLTISFPVIGVIAVAMGGVIWSDPVWVWINGDEEEDTVRFRQRLVFAIFWLVTLGLIQLKNSIR